MSAQAKSAVSAAAVLAAISLPLNPHGAKGAGEVSTIPAAAAVISAVEDALQPFGVRIAQTPVTPHKLVELVNAGGRS